MYKVYVAEDAVLVRKEIVQTTPWEDFNCVVVGQSGNGEEANRQILELQPDIAIIDIQMPGMNGLDLIHSLKQADVKTEFIVISGYSEFAYAMMAIKLEVRNYILKPISDEELHQTLRKTISRIQDIQKNQYLVSKVQDSVHNNRLQFDSILKVNPNQIKYSKKVTDYLKEHYMDDITIKDVAAYFYISESYLSKIFKKELNVTFNDYLTHIRIKMSLNMLKSGEYKIYEIAANVGYKDYRYFSMMFKKLVGMTPKEYGQLCIEDENKAEDSEPVDAAAGALQVLSV